ncbi:MAG: hypothetical protein R3E13_00880 [Alphaproteobacteria bacterium]
MGLKGEFAAACFFDRLTGGVFALPERRIISVAKEFEANKEKNALPLNLLPSVDNLPGVDPAIFTEMYNSDEYADLREYAEPFTDKIRNLITAMGNNTALGNFLREEGGATLDDEKESIKFNLLKGVPIAKHAICDFDTREAIFALAEPMDEEEVERVAVRWAEFLVEARKRTAELNRENTENFAQKRDGGQHKTPFPDHKPVMGITPLK